MANKDHLKRLRQGVNAWNAWRAEDVSVRPNLSKAKLSGADLRDADLRDADLRDADLSKADLRKADLRGVDFSGIGVRRFQDPAEYTALTNIYTSLIDSGVLNLRDLREWDLGEWDLSEWDL